MWNLKNKQKNIAEHTKVREKKIKIIYKKNGTWKVKKKIITM